MNSVTQTIEQNITVLCGQLASAYEEASDIVKAYFSTNASSLVSGAGANDPVTVSSALTKTKYVNGIIMCQQLQNLVGAQVVTTGDYNSSAQNLLHGSNAANAILSGDVESIGSRLQSLAGTLLQMAKASKSLLSIYSSAQLSAALTALSGDPIVYGCNTGKTKFINGINAVQQFANLMGNQDVAQGDYLSIIEAWLQGI